MATSKGGVRHTQAFTTAKTPSAPVQRAHVVQPNAKHNRPTSAVPGTGRQISDGGTGKVGSANLPTGGVRFGKGAR